MRENGTGTAVKAENLWSLESGEQQEINDKIGLDNTTFADMLVAHVAVVLAEDNEARLLDKIHELEVYCRSWRSLVGRRA